ncbi:hypothetical protein Tco_1017237 [Tanacetum coccineum]|uniref:Uncharacterized protein n=1 Tax=Tanacetum coccineum TaxID=301880 RepID=A0ABQ5FSX1_9ASTR
MMTNLHYGNCRGVLQAIKGALYRRSSGGRRISASHILEIQFYSVPILSDSVAKLLELEFEWILPDAVSMIQTASHLSPDAVRIIQKTSQESGLESFINLHTR